MVKRLVLLSMTLMICNLLVSAGHILSPGIGKWKRKIIAALHLNERPQEEGNEGGEAQGMNKQTSTKSKASPHANPLFGFSEPPPSCKHLRSVGNLTALFAVGSLNLSWLCSAHRSHQML